MKDFFRHNGILILIAAILLALVTAVVSMLFGGVADPLSNLVGILTTPVRNGITAVTNWAEEKYNDAFELEQMKEELAGLKQRNAELEAQAREAEAALQENERLRNLLELQPKEWSCDKAAAMVTARSTSNWESTLTISKGSNMDIAVDDCVVDEYWNLVGVVAEVGENWATVRTLVDSDTEMGGQLARTGGAAILEGDFALMGEGRLKLTYLPENIPEWIQEYWGVDDFLFIGAAGIAVRMIAPSVKDKYTDSAVLVMDEKAQHIIPLLSGHMGGAIPLAEQIADITGAIPVITTATDVQRKFAVDAFARDHYLKIADREKAKLISVAVLEGESVGIYVEDGYPLLKQKAIKETEQYTELKWCDSKDMLNEYEYGVCISTDTKDSSKRILVLQIGNVVAGVGCRKGTAMQILEQGISETTARHGLDQRQLEAIVSIDLKAEETGLNELSEKWKVPFITYTSEQLKSTGEASSSSEFVQQVTGVDNVCERAVKYYLKDEKDGKIIQEKLRLDRMTVSLGMRY